ncbi:PREDICTED: uncharacterized protein LOC105562737 [Vollenhovia emeryi]|uniref:uncharacterized protein LOC105562737 n=1 Tax=Vollenhovia emeryi TaxID=411798 RepID=UPI0005F45798|nr:PREDICTED: uncharacterized protein LOC105562737 [Vollenhovia emeryi]
MNRYVMEHTRLHCSVCNNMISHGLNGLRQHFINYHGLTITRKMGNTDFVCGQNGCQRKYKFFFKLREHIRKQHLNKTFNNLKNNEILHDEAIEDLFKTIDIEYLFHNLRTLDQHMTALKTTYGYIDPKEIPLGYRMDMVMDNETCSFKPKSVLESCQYVPIIKVLKLLLSNKDIMQAIQNEKKSKAGLLESFLDGEHFKIHPFFLKISKCFKIRVNIYP